MKPDDTVMKPDEKSLRQKLMDMQALEKAVQVLMDGLEAVTPTGAIDYRSRRESAEAICNRIEGKCVERTHRIDEKRHTASVEDVLASPAARDSLVRALQKAPGAIEAFVKAAGGELHNRPGE